MRIVGGTLRGLKLAEVGQGDAGAHLRPTSDRVRESIFNLLINGNHPNPIPGARVLDLFAGCGTFTLPLAERAEVHAVEGLAAPLAALDSAWRGANGLRRVTTEVRDLARNPLLPDELNPYDAIVIDPPRAGAEAQAQQIARSRGGTVAWISCESVGFARDARILAQEGFAISRLYVVDQFRWSPHVEIVAEFRRR